MHIDPKDIEYEKRAKSQLLAAGQLSPCLIYEHSRLSPWNSSRNFREMRKMRKIAACATNLSRYSFMARLFVRFHVMSLIGFNLFNPARRRLERKTKAPSRNYLFCKACRWVMDLLIKKEILALHCSSFSSRFMLIFMLFVLEQFVQKVGNVASRIPVQILDMERSM